MDFSCGSNNFKHERHVNAHHPTATNIYQAVQVRVLNNTLKIQHRSSKRPVSVNTFEVFVGRCVQRCVRPKARVGRRCDIG